ncbi:MAG: MCP four helix bundle domain-containing protein [Opitutales bacterium]|nr:MCP four helix bundle domain-containing protein [Opitutales bacterium]
MNDWTIAKRITLGFLCLCAIVSIIGAMSYFSLSTIHRDSGIMGNNALPGAIKIAQIKDNLSQEYSYLERIVRETNAQEKERLTSVFQTLETNNEKLLKEYESTIISEKNLQLFDKSNKLKASFISSSDIILQMAIENRTGEAYNYINDTFFPIYREYRDTLQEMVKFNEERGIEMRDTIENTISTSIFTTTSGIVAALIISIVIATIITRKTNKVLNEAIHAIDDGSNQVAAASFQVSSASNMLAEGASEQASSLEETSSSLEEMASMTAQNAASAGKAKLLADGMKQAADDSAEQMRSMQTAMNAIKESSSGISQIIKTIDEIAFQTNILALNAAVEAARAGEAGAGFAVVAEEVRNLAQRSANSAKETSVKIEEAIKNSNNGVHISSRVAESLDAILEKTTEMNMLINEIAQASEEQNRGISQLTVAVSEVDKVTQSNASNAEETASAAEELSAHANGLKETVQIMKALVQKSANANGATGSQNGIASGMNTFINTAPAKTPPHSASSKNGLHSKKQETRFLSMSN